MKRFQTAALFCLLSAPGLVWMSGLSAGLQAADRLSGREMTVRSDMVRPDGTLDFVRPDGSSFATIVIEIAETTEAKMEGLMGRPALDVNSGMLFVYEREAVLYFWMKNTLISLDIIFVNDEKRIVHIVESAVPMSEQFHSSRFPARYVVEVPAGFVKLFGIKTGNLIRWRTR